MAKRSKRQVSLQCFKKWQSFYDKEYQTLSWLKCDVDQDDKTSVHLLWCAVCRQFEDYIRSTKNFSEAWIYGSDNHRVSNITDHAKSTQHNTAMFRLRLEQKKESGGSIVQFSPIARALCTLDEAAKNRLRKLYDVCFIMAKESIAFKKFPILLELESHHGVEFGSTYKNRQSAQIFTHFIAESQRETCITSLSKVSFISLLMDGTTDAGNIEDELIVLLHFVKDDAKEIVGTVTRFFAVEVPTKADSDGLIKCTGNALKCLGVGDILNKAQHLQATKGPILIGVGTDGASVNIGEQNGMKGKLQEALPWLFWSWCYAHRLELACKDALSSDLFKEIEDMLLRLYYIYEKSPKKCRELAEISEDLKEVYDFGKGGDKPLRSHGSRWISYKRKSLLRILERYGAYILHLSALSEDTSVKSEDRARFKGYVKRWQKSEFLIGSALYTDILQLLSLSLQDSTLDIVQGINYILKSVSQLQMLSSTNTMQWPSVKYICDKITSSDGNAVYEYQGAQLFDYSVTTLQKCCDRAVGDLNRLTESMLNRLDWSDPHLLNAILTILDTQHWQETASTNLDELNVAIDLITAHFRLPLQSKGVCFAALRDELEAVVLYARKFLGIDKEKYHKVWYKLHASPDAAAWKNVLLISELLFSLPFSNGRVEGIFSTLKVIKTDARTSLKNQTLNDLMEIKVEGPSLGQFNPDHAIDLWYKDTCTPRRVNYSDSAGPSSCAGSVSSRAGPSMSTTTLGPADPRAAGADEVAVMSLDGWDSLTLLSQ